MWNKGPVAVITVTSEGARLAAFLAQELHAALYLRQGLATEGVSPCFFEKLSEVIPELFDRYQGLVFVMAQGIVTRVIAPFLRDKYHDPAVVVVDDQGRFVVSALSGHEGGANDLALWVSSLTGAEPVITTASEAQRTYLVGLGWRKGTPAVNIIQAVHEALAEAEVPLAEVRLLASAWIKREDPVVSEVSAALGLPWRFFPKWLLRYFYEVWERPKSKAAFRHLGVYGVAEPCALLSGCHTRLVLARRVYHEVTVAVAKEHLPGARLFTPSPEILILGGTTEAVRLAQRLSAKGELFYLSVATSYGEELFAHLVPEEYLLQTRFTKEGLRAFVQEKGIRRIIDCTHPYAEEITRIAQEVAAEEGLIYTSLVRKPESISEAGEKVLWVSSLTEAAERIQALGLKRVLFTTGSKDLSFVPLLTDCEVFVRVLPYEESIRACVAAGLPRQRIIAMQGPFSQEFNLALIRAYGFEALVTKASGREGGFPEKLAACRQADIWAMVVSRR